LDYFLCYVNLQYGSVSGSSFANLFGVTKETAAILYAHAIKQNTKVEPQWVLLFLHWCRQHPTHRHASFIWHCDPKTWRAHFRVVFICLASLKMIDFDDRSKRLFCFVLDGTECPIRRTSSGLQRTYYSGKAKRHTIKYELGVHPDTGKIVWVGGPAPGSVHDISMTRIFGVLEKLLRGEVILGDKGYVGEFQIMTPIKPGRREKLNDDEKTLNHFLGSRRWIVEHLIGRLKNFKCLSEKWRLALPLHSFVFYILCNIVNIDLEFRPMRK